MEAAKVLMNECVVLPLTGSAPLLAMAVVRSMATAHTVVAEPLLLHYVLSLSRQHVTEIRTGIDIMVISTLVFG